MEDEQLHGSRGGDDVLAGFAPPARRSEERDAKRGGERPRRLRRRLADEAESSTATPLRRRVGGCDPRRERERHAEGTSRRRVEAFEERSEGDDGAGRSTGKRSAAVHVCVGVFSVSAADRRGGEDGVVEAVGEEWFGEGLQVELEHVRHDAGVCDVEERGGGAAVVSRAALRRLGGVAARAEQALRVRDGGCAGDGGRGAGVGTGGSAAGDDVGREGFEIARAGWVRLGGAGFGGARARMDAVRGTSGRGTGGRGEVRRGRTVRVEPGDRLGDDARNAAAALPARVLHGRAEHRHRGRRPRAARAERLLAIPRRRDETVVGRGARTGRLARGDRPREANEGKRAHARVRSRTERRGRAREDATCGARATGTRDAAGARASRKSGGREAHECDFASFPMRKQLAYKYPVKRGREKRAKVYPVHRSYDSHLEESRGRPFSSRLSALPPLARGAR